MLIGAIAGWLAGNIMKGGGYGLLMNIIIGIIGAAIGNFIFGLLNISLGSGIVSAVVTATIGAIILLFIVSKLKKA